MKRVKAKAPEIDKKGSAYKSGFSSGLEAAKEGREREDVEMRLLRSPDQRQGWLDGWDSMDNAAPKQRK